MESVLTKILQFLRVGEKIFTTLKKIKSEIDVADKNARNANLVTKVVCYGATITSVVCLVAAPFTARASAPVSAWMDVLCRTSAAVSAVVTVVQHIKESGLMKTASKVVKKDQQAKERVQAVAKIMKTLEMVSVNSLQFLQKASEIGLMTTKKVNAVAQIATKAAQVNKVTKIAGAVLVIVMIPLDLRRIVELLGKGKILEASIHILMKIPELQTEYKTVKKLLDDGSLF